MDDNTMPMSEVVAPGGSRIPDVAETTPAENNADATNAVLSDSAQKQKWIQVSVEKTPHFYARLGKRMLMTSEEGVIVTGLGNATNVAIGAASIMEREDVATITKVETAYFTSNRAKRRLPKITITLLRNPKLLEEMERVATQTAEREQQTSAPIAVTTAA